MTELIDLKNIHSDGRHNTFIDITIWKGYFYASFRTAESHGVIYRGFYLSMGSIFVRRIISFSSESIFLTLSKFKIQFMPFNKSSYLVNHQFEKMWMVRSSDPSNMRTYKYIFYFFKRSLLLGMGSGSNASIPAMMSPELRRFIKAAESTTAPLETFIKTQPDLKRSN